MADNYEIIRVGKNRRAQKDFINLLWDLYDGDPNWVPPLIMNQQELVGFRYNPFYDRNKCVNFVVRKAGRPIGRITAIVNVGHNERYDEKRGFFGFFECANDAQAARMLFDAASDYLANEEG